MAKKDLACHSFASLRTESEGAQRRKNLKGRFFAPPYGRAQNDITEIALSSHRLRGRTLRNDDSHKGIFITFDGPEGCGKSTHSKLVADYLRSKGKDILYTREPGGTKIGEAIRDVLLDLRNKGMAVMAEAFLYLAARAQIVHEIILPALKKGKIVICDRFQDATVVYQGYSGGLDIGMLNKLGDIATGNLRPGLTIILDIDVELGLKRAGCKDRMEKKSLAFHKKVRQGYLSLAKSQPNRIKVIKVKGAIPQTQEEIRKIIDKYVF